MIPGHTKFSPDRWFGALKNKINNFSHDIESFIDLMKVVKQFGKEKYITTSEVYDKDNFIKIYDFKDKFDDLFEKFSSKLELF